MWALAWMQLGVDIVFCLPTTDLAQEQLSEIRTHSPFSEQIKISKDLQRKQEDKTTIICAHLTSSSALDRYSKFVIDSGHNRIQIISVAPITALQELVRIRLGATYRWTTLRHTYLGGLTSARIMIGWDGFPEGATCKLKRYPTRPLGRFLEPAARLEEWRPARPDAPDCWYPDSDASRPYPWPLHTSPLWVETTTVFFKCKIHRKLTQKEKCQLLDIKHEWSFLLEKIWEWHDGGVPPLRFYIEFVLSMITHLNQRRGKREEVEREQEKIRSSAVHWGRKRAPWLGQGDVSDQEQVERLNYFGWIWDDGDSEDVSVACKGDDAQVNLALWAVGGDSEAYEQARGTIRNFLWRYWYRSLYLEASTWLKGNDSDENRDAIRDCLERCAESDWWNWNKGSRLHFWRWPSLWIKEARDGAPGFHTKQPRPRKHFPEVPIQEDWIREKDIEKLEKLIIRGYIVPGFCRVTVPRFPVPKGDDDIRVVWDLAKNGLNATMYTPTFFLASMPTYIRRLEVGSFGGDFDIGEQFHNYILHAMEQPNCGVRIPDQIKENLRGKVQVDTYMRWGRLVFGWQSSPYLALRMLARALELAKGQPDTPGNPFGWATIHLNLPGSKDYNPKWGRVRKINETGEIAADIVSFYDDGRVFGPTEEVAHKALRQITSRLQFYGNQDAARKRRKISQRPGAWAGGIVYSDQNVLRVFVSASKWEKARVFLNWVWDVLQQPTPLLERKRFRSGKGFLVYMSTCYEFMQPFLKGFHLSEDAWRGGRDREGWKEKESRGSWDEEDDNTEFYPESEAENVTYADDVIVGDEPPMITPVPRLREDVRILRLFLHGETPVQVIPRPVTGMSFVAYGGGDASGEGFGGQISPMGMTPLLRRGFWCSMASDESSNWRELRNLIDTVREEAEAGRLVGRELWLATDNSTAANAYHHGSSKSKKLHEMITELRLLTIEGNFRLHLYHVAGTRMIESGIDALSRGELHVSALTKSLTTLLPLHQSPIERSPTLRHWLQSWLDETHQITTPSDWFYQAQQAGEYDLPTRSKTWVWDLAPGAALHALEELGMARLKRHEILRGVVLVPSLLTPEWGRRFARIVDVYFTIPAGALPEWPSNMHESLTVGFYFPLFRYEPWDWKRVPFMVPFGIAMSSMHKTRAMEARDILRKFWDASTGVATMPQRLVSALLQSTSWRKFLGVSD